MDSKFKSVRSALFLSPIIFALIFIGCEESDLTTACGVKNPVNDIEWLADLIATAKNDTLDSIVNGKVLLYMGHLILHNIAIRIQR